MNGRHCGSVAPGLPSLFGGPLGIFPRQGVPSGPARQRAQGAIASAKTCKRRGKTPESSLGSAYGSFQPFWIPR